LPFSKEIFVLPIFLTQKFDKISSSSSTFCKYKKQKYGKQGQQKKRENEKQKATHLDVLEVFLSMFFHGVHVS
jgi:hypothetical protein